MVGGALALFLLLTLAWVAWNLWPRVQPPPLFQPSQLNKPYDPAIGLIDPLLILRGSASSTPEEWEVPDVLFPLLKSPFPLNSEGAERYWDEAALLQGRIKSYFHQPRLPLAELIKMLELAEIADLSKPQLGAPAFPVFPVLDYQRVVSLSIVDQMLDGHIETAYARWKGRYLQDLFWLKTARSLISHLGAIRALEWDLSLLRLMVHLHPPASPAEWIQWLKAHPPAEMDLKDALVFEYLQGLDSLERVAANPKKSLGMPIALLLNRPWLRENYNRHYREIGKVLNGSPAAVEKGLKGLDQKINGLTDSPLWWISNPAGKILLKSVQVSLVQPVKRFTEFREKVNSLNRDVQSALREGPRKALAELPAKSEEENIGEPTPAPSPPVSPAPQPSPPPKAQENPEEP